MINFIFYTNPTLALACVSRDAPLFYSLEAAAQRSGVHPEMLRYYWRLGVLEAHHGAWEDELFFDDTAVQEVRRLEHYRRHLGISRRALPLICELRRESERQHIELRFLSIP